MNDHHYAVVVGINRYPGIGDLSGARADAETFADWLGEPTGGGLPKENIKRVIATTTEERRYLRAPGAKPTNHEIDDALHELSKTVRAALLQDAGAWDRTRLYLYVAGHGFAPQGGEGALFLANAETGALSRNIELLEYRRWCTTCAWFREVVVFADCCRTRVRGGARGVGPQLDPCERPWKERSSTWVIGFGATLASETYEAIADAGAGEARGYFTAALLEGLNGDAPVDPEVGVITHETLARHVKSLVHQRTGGAQDADIIGALGVSVLFGVAAARTTRTVTIVFPTAFAGSVRLVKDHRALATWPAGAGDWTIPLEDGLYEVAPVPAGSAAFRADGLFKVAGENRDVAL